ncbi:hypothetical protein QG37_06221 [Candidozyma auris]|nr:hypothetical protein QG37_06221 [[Candida] auris]
MWLHSVQRGYGSQHQAATTSAWPSDEAEIMWESVSITKQHHQAATAAATAAAVRESREEKRQFARSASWSRVLWQNSQGASEPRRTRNETGQEASSSLVVAARGVTCE